MGQHIVAMVLRCTSRTARGRRKEAKENGPQDEEVSMTLRVTVAGDMVNFYYVFNETRPPIGYCCDSYVEKYHFNICLS